ncbi:hypothetical protein SBBP1_750026 [Burkholderiales bacterium]|nr:hypothetical protein SBBP1_750026 [Burkholderiales bacterium]
MRDHCIGVASNPSVQRYNSSNQRSRVCSERVGHTVAHISPAGTLSILLQIDCAGQRCEGIMDKGGTRSGPRPAAPLATATARTARIAGKIARLRWGAGAAGTGPR